MGKIPITKLWHCSRAVMKGIKNRTLFLSIMQWKIAVKVLWKHPKTAFHAFHTTKDKKELLIIDGLPKDNIYPVRLTLPLPKGALS